MVGEKNSRDDNFLSDPKRVWGKFPQQSKIQDESRFVKKLISAYYFGDEIFNLRTS